MASAAILTVLKENDSCKTIIYKWKCREKKSFTSTVPLMFIAIEIYVQKSCINAQHSKHSYGGKSGTRVTELSSI